MIRSRQCRSSPWSGRRSDAIEAAGLAWQYKVPAQRDSGGAKGIQRSNTCASSAIVLSGSPCYQASPSASIASDRRPGQGLLLRRLVQGRKNGASGTRQEECAVLGEAGRIGASCARQVERCLLPSCVPIRSRQAPRRCAVPPFDARECSKARLSSVQALMPDDTGGRDG